MNGLQMHVSLTYDYIPVLFWGTFMVWWVIYINIEQIFYLSSFVSFFTKLHQIFMGIPGN